MNQTSNLKGLERQALDPVITSPAEGPEKLNSLVRVSYVADLVFLSWGASTSGLSGQLVLKNTAILALGLLSIAIVVKLFLQLVSSQVIALKAIHWNPKLLRTMAIVIILLAIASFLSLADTSLGLVPPVVVAIVSYKLSELFIQLLPGSNALPVAQLNSAGKVMVMVEFFPILLGRAASAPILILGDVSSGGLLMLVTAAFFGLGLLIPETQSFLGKCSKCHGQDHKLIIRTFGTCCACKRYSLANSRS